MLTLAVNLVRTVLSAVYLLLLTQSLVQLSCHTHQNVISQQKYGQIINCGLTILIVSVFPVTLAKFDTA